MTKEELEQYARENRKRLDAQEVKIGDVVKVLVGQFAGETGIVVGIIACDKYDYTDLYYEIALNCEVPAKYKCRKTLVPPNNVAGGFSAHEFEVIGNRAPKQPSSEIKVGDKVRVREDAPRLYTRGLWEVFEKRDSNVDSVEDGTAVISTGPHIIAIPLKYLIKVEEEKKLKFKIGDKVIFIPTGKVKVVSRINANSQYVITEPNGQSPLCARETELAPYIEHNAPKFKVGDRVRNVKSDLCGIALNIEHGIVEVGIPYDKEKHYWNTDIVELFEPTEQTEAEKKPYDGISEETANEISDMLEAYAKALSGIADSFDWQRYEADLAKEIALKVANKFNAPKEVAAYAVSVAKAVVEGLKRK